MKSGAVVISALLLGFIALAHLERIFFPYPIMFGNLSIPLWGSAIAFIVAGSLSGFLFGSLNKAD